MKKKELTPKQEIFCRWYAEIGNAAEAYRQAYNVTNMSLDSVYSLSSRLLKKVQIRSRVDELLQERNESLKNEREIYRDTMRAILEADVTDLFYEDKETGQPKVRNPLQLSHHTRKAIKRVTVNRGRITYEFVDKVQAGKALSDLEGWDKPKETNINVSGLPKTSTGDRLFIKKK